MPMTDDPLKQWALGQQGRGKRNEPIYQVSANRNGVSDGCCSIPNDYGNDKCEGWKYGPRHLQWGVLRSGLRRNERGMHLLPV